MSEITIYEVDQHQIEVQLDTEQDTVWLSQRQMSELFETTPENILMHIKGIFRDEELVEEATTKDFLVVRQEGKRQVKRHIIHYNLDAIISVGYRVSSRRAVLFRQWATRILREHLGGRGQSPFLPDAILVSTSRVGRADMAVDARFDQMHVGGGDDLPFVGQEFCESLWFQYPGVG